MNVGVTPDANGHYVVEAHLQDRRHPGFFKYRPLRKFIMQGDAILFARMLREHKLSTPAEIYADSYDENRVVASMKLTNDCTKFKLNLIPVK